MSNHYLILVAGGSGNRMETKLPKQFISVNNVPILVIAINQFLKFDKSLQVIISVHPNYILLLKKIARKYFKNQSIQIVEGGKTRFHSVKNALTLIHNKKGIVAIHDAARPFVSVEVIKNCFTTAKNKGNAIAAFPLSESLRELKGKTSKAVDRNRFCLVQTPQCFSIPEISEAYKQRYRSDFTDDATVLESKRKKINLVDGNRENIKITYQSDLLLAKIFIQAK